MFIMRTPIHTNTHGEKMFEEINKKYKTIIIDPPWKLKIMGRHVRPNQKKMPYKMMDLKEIKEIPINNISDENCHIYLWTTNRYLRDAFDVLKAWGFKFHCILVWKKATGITPYSFQFVNEFVLFGYKGKFKINKRGIPTTFEERIKEHSRKPNILYKIAEQVSDAPRIELFARNRREGWDAWGNEVPKECQNILK